MAREGSVHHTPNSRLPRFVRLTALVLCGFGVCEKGAGAGRDCTPRESSRTALGHQPENVRSALRLLWWCRRNSERESPTLLAQRPMHPVRVCAAFCLDFIEFLSVTGGPPLLRNYMRPGVRAMLLGSILLGAREYHDLTQQYMRKIPCTLAAPMSSSFEFLFLRLLGVCISFTKASMNLTLILS